MAPEVDQSKASASQTSNVGRCLVLVEWLAPQVWVKDALDEDGRKNSIAEKRLEVAALAGSSCHHRHPMVWNTFGPGSHKPFRSTFASAHGCKNYV